MARRVIGLDIGTYSIKAIGLESGVRDFSLKVCAERRLPSSTTETTIGLVLSNALKELFAEIRWSAEVVITALPGDKVFARTLDLPFNDHKKIGSVLGFELEGHFPVSVDEIIYDYQVIDETSGGVKLYAVAAEKHFVGAYLKMLASGQVDPRIVDMEAFSLVNLAQHVIDDQTVPTAIIDLGHRKTEVCIVYEGRVRDVRTLSRGGHHLTREISRLYECNEHDAETIKHQRAYLALDRQLPLDEEGKKLAEATRRAMFPLVRDIHQSLARFRTEFGQTVKRVLLCGGTSKLGGVYDYLQETLDVSVEPLSVYRLPNCAIPNPSVGEPQAAKGAALAMRILAGKGSSNLNFRRGEFAYEGDFKILRDKVRWLAVVVSIMFILGGVKIAQRFMALEKQSKAQTENLQRLTKRLFGKASSSFRKSLRLISRGPRRSQRIVPKMSAFELFYDTMQVLAQVNTTKLAVTKKSKSPDAEDKKDKKDKTGPDPDQPKKQELVEVFVTWIKVKPKTVMIRAVANSPEAKNLFIDKLSQHKCYKHQKIDEKDPKVTHDGKYRFSLTLDVRCEPEPEVEPQKRKKKT